MRRDGLRRFWLTTEAQDYFPLTSTHALDRVAALGRWRGRVPRSQRAAPRSRRGAGLASAPKTERSGRVAGRDALRGPPGGGGFGRMDHRGQEHAADGARPAFGHGLADVRGARGKAARDGEPREGLVRAGDGAVPARPAGEDLRGHAAGGLSALRVVAARANFREGPAPHGPILRPVAGTGAGDDVVPEAQRHRRDAGPAGGHLLAPGRGRMDGLVLPLQAAAARRPVRHLPALGGGRGDAGSRLRRWRFSRRDSRCSGCAERIGAGRRYSRRRISSSCCCRCSGSRTWRS